jgi:hypothetical protein
MDVLDEVMGGAIGHYNLKTHLETIKELCERIYTWRNEKAAELGDGSFPGGTGDLVYEDLCYEYMFVDAACSQTVVAAICPLIETLFARAFEKIRTARESKHKGRCSVPWKQNRMGFVEHKQKVLDALGFPNAISVDSEVLFALFKFRNNSMHQGYKWEAKELERFSQLVKSRNASQGRWKNWFDISTLGDDPYLVTITKSLAAAALNSVKSVAQKLRDVEQSI